MRGFTSQFFKNIVIIILISISLIYIKNFIDENLFLYKHSIIAFYEYKILIFDKIRKVI